VKNAVPVLFYPHFPAASLNPIAAGLACVIVQDLKITNPGNCRDGSVRTGYSFSGIAAAVHSGLPVPGRERMVPVA
jgi:hypothetical protein